MHELGHGMQSMMTTVEHPILKGYEWCLGNICPAYMEGTAELLVNFVTNVEWMRRYAGMSEEDVRKKKILAKEYHPAYLRWRMRNFMFEIALYRNLDREPGELYREMTQEYLMVDAQSDAPYSLSNSIMYVSYPVYLQNYIIGEMMAWQVHAALQDRFGADYPFNANVGEYLKENLWKDGVLHPWQDRVRMATGKTLDVEGYLEACGFVDE
jgi:hypothetical protein